MTKEIVQLTVLNELESRLNEFADSFDKNTQVISQKTKSIHCVMEPLGEPVDVGESKEPVTFFERMNALARRLEGINYELSENVDRLKGIIH